MYFSISLSIACLLAIKVSVAGLGINCRGSSVRHFITGTKDMAQLLYDAVWDSLYLSSTVYNSGDHISCHQVYNIIDHPKDPALTTALLKHGCKICGSVPIHFVDQGSNNPGSGILVFNYVENPVCAGNCIPAD